MQLPVDPRLVKRGEIVLSLEYRAKYLLVGLAATVFAASDFVHTLCLRRHRRAASAIRP
jgi:hypothetical protein